MIVTLVSDLFVILTVGLISGIVSKRLGFSMLVGYLLAGAVVGQAGFGLPTQFARRSSLVLPCSRYIDARAGSHCWGAFERICLTDGIVISTAPPF